MWAEVILVLSAAGWVAMIWHIHTLSKKREHEHAKDQALLESLGEGIVVTDKDGNVELVNPAAEQLLGWKHEEAVGKKWYDLAPLEDEKGNRIPPERRATQLVLTSGRPRSNATYYYVRRNGTKFAVGTTASPVVVDGKTVGVIAVFRDISHEREVDRAKSEFVSLASHQLRTPLSAVKWFTEMLLTGDAGTLTAEQKDYLQNIDASNERTINLVNSLLNISRIESGRIIIDPEPTDLAKLVSETVATLEVRFREKKLKIEVQVPDNLPHINIDPRMVSQVYTNLLTNAIKYTPEGGHISVSITIKGEDVISQVKDSGYGIPQTEQHRVYEKFYRGSNIISKETDGTGLGLYLVKAIIESSKGKIWFESHENQGTSFWFTLPLAGMNAKAGEVELTPVL